MRVLINTGGTQGIASADYDSTGVAETGLDYSRLVGFSIFNGGGTGSVTTTILFSDFSTGAGHVRGLLAVARVAGLTGTVTVASSPSGAVATWPQVGSTFVVDPADTSSITWDAPSGTLTTLAPVGHDSRTIVINLGDLAQVDTISLSLQQHLNDGIVFFIGEQIDTATGVEFPPATTWGRIKGTYR